MPVPSKEKRAPMWPKNSNNGCSLVTKHRIIQKKLEATIDAENNNTLQDCNEKFKENKSANQINRNRPVKKVSEVTNDSSSTKQSPCYVKLVDLFQNNSPYLKYFKKIVKNKGGRPKKVKRGPKKQTDTLKRDKRANKRIRPTKELINEKTQPIDVETKSRNEMVTCDSSSTNQSPCSVKLVDLFQNDSPYLKYFKELKVQSRNGNNLLKDNRVTVSESFSLCSVKLVDFKLHNPASYINLLSKIMKNRGRPKKVKRGPKKANDSLQRDKKANKRIRPKKDIIIVKMPFKRRGELLKNKYAKKRKLDKIKKKEKKLNKKMPELKVTSEIYDEFDYRTKNTPSVEENVISEFPFLLPKSLSEKKFDGDNDLERPQKKIIKIEHSPRTNIALVGLQVWRGAFLLGDLIIYLGLKGELKTKTVLELGAGTGITSFVASMFAGNVVCTDMNTGGILDLMKLNAKYNSHLLKSPLKVLPLDFTEPTWSKELIDAVSSTDIILAADVIYDDDVTAAFVATMQKILNTRPPKTIYIALEKRYVFTIEHMDSVAPCYETFLTLLDKVKTENVHSKWTVEQLPLDFPKYFTYERVKELVLWKITSTPC